MHNTHTHDVYYFVMQIQIQLDTEKIVFFKQNKTINNTIRKIEIFNHSYM